jgi:hypothetical protein
MRIILAVTMLAGMSSLAAAQSTTATTGSTAPLATAPSSATTLPNGQPKAQIKPPAYMGKSGLRVGNDATDAGPVEIRRVK